MGAAIIVFVLITGVVLGGYAAATRLPVILAARRLNRRLSEVSGRDEAPSDATVLNQRTIGPLPGVERLVGGTAAGSWLARLIEQSGVRTSPSSVLLKSVAAGATLAILAALFVHQPIATVIAGLAGSLLPIGWLAHKRSTRLKKFEEQFPEALDMLSRAIRAGHAFQTAMGMVADELPAPVGVEFKKCFDQQNFGLPLRDAFAQLSQRVPILDVRFFITAVQIQRETGGNLAEILDNLAHVVRERFKIRRQVRVHTAHGRFTGYVLLAMPAALAVALSYISPDHMRQLFYERMGQTMVLGAIVMQTIGFFWIQRVIKIEV